MSDYTLRCDVCGERLALDGSDGRVRELFSDCYAPAVWPEWRRGIVGDVSRFPPVQMVCDSCYAPALIEAYEGLGFQWEPDVSAADQRKNLPWHWSHSDGTHEDLFAFIAADMLLRTLAEM